MNYRASNIALVGDASIELATFIAIVTAVALIALLALIVMAVALIALIALFALIALLALVAGAVQPAMRMPAEVLA